MDKTPLLDGLKIASPCAVPWESMSGNDRVRACASCKMNVYNLSDMTRAEAESLLAVSEGRTCVSFFRRADGTILTKDCPVGLRAVRLRLALAASAAVAACAWALAFLAGRETPRGIGMRTAGNISASLTRVGGAKAPPMRTAGAPMTPARTMGEAVRPDSGQ